MLSDRPGRSHWVPPVARRGSEEPPQQPRDRVKGVTDARITSNQIRSSCAEEEEDEHANHVLRRRVAVFGGLGFGHRHRERSWLRRESEPDDSDQNQQDHPEGDEADPSTAHQRQNDGQDQRDDHEDDERPASRLSLGALLRHAQQCRRFLVNGTAPTAPNRRVAAHPRASLQHPDHRHAPQRTEAEDAQADATAG